MNAHLSTWNKQRFLCAHTWSPVDELTEQYRAPGGMQKEMQACGPGSFATGGFIHMGRDSRYSNFPLPGSPRLPVQVLSSSP